MKKFSPQLHSASMYVLVSTAVFFFGLASGSHLFPEHFPSFIQGRLMSFLSISRPEIASFERVYVSSRNPEIIRQIKDEGIVPFHTFVDRGISVSLSSSDISKLKIYTDVTRLGDLSLDSLVAPKPYVNTCLPSKKVEYNTIQVNGGKSGNGFGVLVAVIDTGIDMDHPDLMDQIVDCKNTLGGTASKGCDDKSNDGHGTHVAGIIAGKKGFFLKGMSGVAPSAGLLVVKACEDKICHEDDVAKGIEVAAASGAMIIHLGMSSVQETVFLKKIIAKYPKILFVASVGNHGPDPDKIGYPAAYQNVIAVAAHDANKAVSAFSSRGVNDKNDDKISDREIDFSAGGSEIESPHNDGCYSKVTGTSFASATIAGLAAKVWYEAGESPVAVRDYLRDHSQEIVLSSGGGGDFGYDIASGYGMPVAPE